MSDADPKVQTPRSRPPFRFWVCLWLCMGISGAVGNALARWSVYGIEPTLNSSLKAGTCAAVGSAFGGLTSGQVLGLFVTGACGACGADLNNDESWGRPILASIVVGAVIGTMMRIMLRLYEFNVAYRQNNK